MKLPASKVEGAYQCPICGFEGLQIDARVQMLLKGQKIEAVISDMDNLDQATMLCRSCGFMNKGFFFNRKPKTLSSIQDHIVEHIRSMVFKPEGMATVLSSLFNCSLVETEDGFVLGKEEADEPVDEKGGDEGEVIKGKSGKGNKGSHRNTKPDSS